MPRAKQAKLTSRVVGDRRRRAEAIEAHIRRYCPYRRQQRRILRLQSTLQRLVDREAWAPFLELEDAIHYLDNRAREDLVRWAFRAGTRVRRGTSPSQG